MLDYASMLKGAAPCQEALDFLAEHGDQAWTLCDKPRWFTWLCCRAAVRNRLSEEVLFQWRLSYLRHVGEHFHKFLQLSDHAKCVLFTDGKPHVGEFPLMNRALVMAHDMHAVSWQACEAMVLTGVDYYAAQSLVADAFRKSVDREALESAFAVIQ